MTFPNMTLRPGGRTKQLLVAVLMFLASVSLVRMPTQGRVVPVPRRASKSLEVPVRPTPAIADRSFSPSARAARPRLPLSFEVNHGQLGAGVEFRSRSGGSTLLITSTGPVVSVKPARPSEVGRSHTEGDQGASNWIKAQLEGASALAPVEGMDQLPGTVSYFIGNDPARWQAGVPTYAKVRQRGIYPGVDLVYHGNEQQQFEYDFVVAPAADSGRISLAFNEADRVSVDSSGDLIVKTGAVELRQHRPVSYQEVDGIKTEIASRYVLKGKHRVSFSLGSYDHRIPLVIDPVLIYSTYYGGDTSEGTAIAVDQQGNTYIAGGTSATSFPTTPGAFQRVNPKAVYDDVFVTKLNAAGTAVIYSTVIGGTQDEDDATGIAIDAAGNAYVTGDAASADFPITSGAFQTKIKNHIQNAFVLKLDPTGASLAYSTFLGGNGTSIGNAIALDAAGHAYVAGETSSSNFPVTAGAFQTHYGKQSEGSGFVTKLNLTGSDVVYSTYLGQAEDSFDVGATGIAVDSKGDAYVTGEADGNFETTRGAYSSGYVGQIFMMKLNAAGGAIYSSVFGGSDEDIPNAIAIDGSGFAYITGETDSLDFPTVNAVQENLASGEFLASQDGGAQWNPLDRGIASQPDPGNSIGPLDPFLSAMALDPHSPSTLYLGASNPGAILKSTDSGQTFSVSNVRSTVNAIVVDPASSNNVYAAAEYDGIPSDSGVYSSSDGGVSWAHSGLTFTDETSVLSLAINRGSTSVLYAGTTKGLYQSLDGAKTWARVDTGLQDATFNTLAIYPGSNSTIYAGANDGIQKSQDGGIHWQATTVTNPAITLAIDPTNSSTIYAGISDGSVSATGGDGRGNPRRKIQNGSDLLGIVKSTDGGLTWNAINNGMPYLSYHYGIAFDPLAHSTLYVASDNGLYKTIDAGATWTADQIVVGPTNAVVVASTTPSTVYASTYLSSDAFVAKMDPTGSSLIYSTYLGGINDDRGSGIAVDGQGNAFVAGRTISRDFPTATGAFQTQLGGGSYASVYDGDAFMAELSPTGSLLYSTFFGGDQDDYAAAVALDAAGAVYITGQAGSDNFPILNAIQPIQDIAWGCDAFVAKFSETPATTQSSLAITGVTVTGESLVVRGQGFAAGAVIILNGRDQPTENDSINPATELTSQKAVKRVQVGDSAIVQVKNPDGSRSSDYIFYRPDN
jgi:photosystem II stability/assembly factor-like uncharacterized protein